jgi:hypothetical protein
VRYKVRVSCYNPHFVEVGLGFKYYMSRYWILGCLLIAGQGLTKGLSPYLPLNISPEIEVQIEKVMALTPGAPLSKPYKAVDVMQRNESLAARFPDLHRAVNAYLARYKDTISSTHFSVSGSVNDEKNTALANERGITGDSSYQISKGLVAYISPYAYVAAGGIWADGTGLTHYNTHVAFGYEYAQIEAGYREHWFSPMHDSALLVSTNAKPSLSVTVSNATPISDWAFRYELFYSKLEKVTGINQQGMFFTGKPALAGLHMSISPVDTWSLGISRTVQFAGAINNISLSEALLNLATPASEDESPLFSPQAQASDQKTAISTRLNLPFSFPVSVYGEVAFEDSPQSANAQDTALAVGIYLPMVTDTLALRYEYSSWNELFYQSPFYTQGYTNKQQAIGHWANGLFPLSERSIKTSHAVNINWQFTADQIIDVTIRSANNDMASPQTPNSYTELSARYSFATRYGFWGVDLNVGEDRLGTQFKRVSVFYRW